MSNAAGQTASKPIPIAELKAMLPEAVETWRRAAVDVQLPRGSLIETSVVSATYAAGNRLLLLTLTDWPALAGMKWPAAPSERMVDGGTEKTYVKDGRHVREFAVPGGRSEITVNLSNGVVVRVSSERAETAELKAFVDALKVSRIEALQRPAQ